MSDHLNRPDIRSDPDSAVQQLRTPLIAPMPATELRTTGPLRSLRKACALSCASPSTAESRLNRAVLFLAEPQVSPSAEDGTDNWCHPEEPQLSECPASDKDGWTCTSGRIDRGVGDRNADQMDERQRQTDGDTSKPNRRSP